jgi:hypothetical protein
MSWLWKNIGISDDFVAHLDEARLAFHQEAALWVGLALLVPAAYFIYRRQQRNLRTVPLTPRLFLTATRVLILALLVLVLAGPYLKLDERRDKKPIVAVLFDHSQSMGLRAGPFDNEDELAGIAKAVGYRLEDGQVSPTTRDSLNRVTRAKLVSDVVENSANTFLQPLAEKYEVQFYSVAEDVTPLNAAGKFKLPEPPAPRKTWGTQTHLGDAIDHVLREAAGRPVAGVIVFSDGQNTGGRSLPEAARAAAAAAAPVFTVPAGTFKRPKDVAIVDVFATSLLSVGDTARVAVTVESQGLDNRPVKVELRDGEQLLDSKELRLRSAEQQQLELSFVAKKAGPHFLTVHIPPPPDEPRELHDNNTDYAFVHVSEDRLRVLYLEGLPRWDFRFLKNAMRRDHGLGGRQAAKQPDIVLEAEWRRLPAALRAERLPQTLQALADYHTVVLGDVSPELLNPTLLDGLAKAVREKGVGLIIEAGPLHMPHEFDERLLELLPVRLRRDKGRPVPGFAAENRPFTLELSPAGAIHDATRLYDEPGRNQNAWRYMPPFYWSVAAARPAPAATVLAWNRGVRDNYGKMPLIAHHFAGKGRVLLVGTDSTWGWRQNVGDRYFYKFWGQAIRYVARREDAGRGKSWLEVRPLRAQPGEKASVELMALKPDGSPRSDKTLAVQVSGGKKPAVVRLTADPAVKGRYTGEFPLREVGTYRVTYRDGSKGAAPEGRVRVLASTEELRHPHVDREALRRLGNGSGGQLVELTELAAIPDKLKGETKSSSSHRETDIWDNWLVLALLMFLYSLDVGLRRLAGLS